MSAQVIDDLLAYRRRRGRKSVPQPYKKSKIIVAAYFPVDEWTHTEIKHYLAGLGYEALYSESYSIKGKKRHEYFTHKVIDYIPAGSGTARYKNKSFWALYGYKLGWRS